MRASKPPDHRLASALWAGRLLSGLAVLFLIFDGAIKLVPLEIAITTSKEMWLPVTAAFARFLSVVTLACTLLYASRRTAPLGAVLLTGSAASSPPT